jgi:heme-degrading monooxygenase HmoA
MMAMRVLLQIDVSPGREKEFEDLWQAHSAHVRSLPDNHGQALLRRTDNPSGYVVLTDWTDEATFRAFEQSAPQQEYLRQLWPMRVSGAMALLTTVHELRPQAAAGTH